MIWLFFGALGLVAAGVLLWGLLRRPGAAAARAEHDLEVFRAQLRELEREVEAGLVDAGESEAARIEIQRRMLAADGAREGRRGAGTPRSGWAVPVVVSVAVPGAAFALYLVLGSPQTPSVPFAGRAGTGTTQTAGAPAQQMVPDVETMMARLQQRLAENPDDLQGWVTLGQSLLVMGRHDEAVRAYDQAIVLDDGVAFLHAARGEALIRAANGAITEAARAAFQRALALDASDTRARFYTAVAKEQDGDRAGALDGLVALLDSAAPDASWYTGVREHAAALATDMGLDPDAVLPPARAVADAPPQVSPATAAERLAARLEANPKDYQGWIALAEVRAALGDREGARAALDRGAEVYEGAPFVLQQFRQTASALGLDGTEAPRGPSAEDIEAAGEMSAEDQQAMIRGMVESLAERLQDAPDDPEGWRMLARSYGVLGEAEKAVEAHRRLAELLPDDATAQLDYAAAIIAAQSEGAPPTRELIATLRRVIELDAANADALYYLGEASQRQGDMTGAALYWNRLLAQLPPGTREHDWIRAKIDNLDRAQ